jgi:protein-tyrosine phosphatase
MFSIFKAKLILKDLIPSNYVDIHSHLLPGIDDGAPSFNDTLLLLNKMIAMGFCQFITTPHVFGGVWDNSRTGILDLQDKTNFDLKNNAINVTFCAAAEYMMDSEFVNLFQNQKLLTLKDNYVLVEMSYLNAPIQLYQIIFDLQIAGYIPVLAHPERYAFYHNNFDEYHKLKKSGCLFQLNLLSTVGYYGDNEAKIADKLLENGMVDFVGSDIHHEKHIANFENKIVIKHIDELKIAINKNEFFSSNS